MSDSGGHVGQPGELAGCLHGRVERGWFRFLGWRVLIPGWGDQPGVADGLWPGKA